jgi:L-ascorbate metabolism protein UlaG (beta-lactamase superfamily)
MKVTYYGHSSFGVEAGGKTLLFDPFISGNPLAASIKIDGIKADFILLSHAHQDHVLDAEAIAKKTGATIVCNYEVYLYYSKKGLKNIRPMNPGGTFNVGNGLKIKCVVAIHTSTFDDGANGGMPMGFVVSSPEGSFYFAGDTALTYDMKLIAEHFALKFAFLPIGDNFTMGVEDAISACDFIRCNNIIGMHFNTFDIIKINEAEAKSKFEKAGKSLTLMNIGEIRDL